MRAWGGKALQTPCRLPARQLAADEKLRVGFLSSDLCGHAIGHLVVGLFEHLPHERIEWWAYHNAFDDSSSVRDRLRQPFDRAVNVARLDGRELAQRIRDDGIDVLIDLNQMMAMTRVEVMAWPPPGWRR